MGAACSGLHDTPAPMPAARPSVVKFCVANFGRIWAESRLSEQLFDNSRPTFRQLVDNSGARWVRQGIFPKRVPGMFVFAFFGYATSLCHTRPPQGRRHRTGMGGGRASMTGVAPTAKPPATSAAWALPDAAAATPGDALRPGARFAHVCGGQAAAASHGNGRTMSLGGSRPEASGRRRAKRRAMERCGAHGRTCTLWEPEAHRASQCLSV